MDQDEVYRQEVFPPDIKARVAVEAGSPMGWSKWVGDEGRVIGIDKFGASAPYKEIYQNYGLSTENIMKVAKEILNTDQARESQG
jgi:transketolase